VDAAAGGEPAVRLRGSGDVAADDARLKREAAAVLAEDAAAVRLRGDGPGRHIAGDVGSNQRERPPVVDAAAAGLRERTRAGRAFRDYARDRDPRLCAVTGDDAVADRHRRALARPVRGR